MKPLTITSEVINALQVMKNSDLLVKLLKQFAEKTYGKRK
jgi:hypothetical protein